MRGRNDKPNASDQSKLATYLASRQLGSVLGSLLNTGNRGQIADKLRTHLKTLPKGGQ